MTLRVVKRLDIKIGAALKLALVILSFLATPALWAKPYLDTLNLSYTAPHPGEFMVNVYFPQLPPGNSSVASCSTYDQGRLIHHAKVKESRYFYYLPGRYLHADLYVRCTHPRFQDVGGQLGPAQYYLQYTRGLYLSFHTPNLAQSVRTEYNDQQQIKALQLTVELPPVTLKTVELDGFGEFTKLDFATDQIPLLAGSEYESWPEVPILNPLVVIPRDSDIQRIKVKYDGLSRYEDIRLLPVQASKSEAADYIDENPNPFDREVYFQTISRIGDQLYEQPIHSRSFALRKLASQLVNYNPRTKVLEIPKKVHFRLEFTETSSCYRQSQPNQDPVKALLSQGYPALVRQAVNFSELSAAGPCRDVIYYRSSPDSDNTDIRSETRSTPSPEIVILSHSRFWTAAQHLAKHKRSLGWYTTVLQGDDLSPESMRKKIQGLAPQWLILLGDAEFLATYYHREQPYIINRFDRSFAAGDTFLAQTTDDRLNPGSFSIGRLPVDTPAQAHSIVEKIIQYEIDPPVKKDFYGQPVWSADLEYAAALEQYYLNDASQFGLNPRRLYVQGAEPIPEDWDYLRPADVTWDSDATDINLALSSGRTPILLHRGHADWYGWQSPAYSVSDTQNLRTEPSSFPFVLSINCSSGFFDNETAARLAVPPSPPRRGATPYANAQADDLIFAEALIRKADGALGVIADTRASDHALNRTMAEAAFNSIYRFDPHASPLTRGRLGQLLLEAKAAVVGKHTSLREISNHLLIYNLLGDPSLYLHESTPYEITDFRLDRQQGKGSFALKVPKCADCLPSLARQQNMIVSMQRGGRILARTLARQETGEATRFSFAFEANDGFAEKADSLTISGPGVIPMRRSLQPARPNLTVAVSGPSILKPGNNPGISLAIKVANEGTATAFGTMDAPTGQGYMLDLVLSTDEDLPTGWAVFQGQFKEDVLLRGGRLSNTKLVAAGSRRKMIQQHVELPKDTPPGRYCLGVRIDPGDKITESQEDDNTSCLWIQVRR